MDYGNILSRAWQLTWKHKILWVFGFLAALGGGGGGGGNFSGNFGGGGGDGPSPFPTPGPGGRFPNLPSQFNDSNFAFVIFCIACVVIILAIVLFVLGTIGRGGLIGGIRIADDNGQVTFGEAWSVGTRYFWRLFGLWLLIFVPVVAIVLLLVGIGVLTAGLAFICILPLLCLFALALIPVAIITHFAQYAIVLEDKPVVESLRRGWEVFTKNLGNSIVLGLIVIVLSLIIGFVMALPFILAAVPLIFGLASGAREPNVGLLATAGIIFCCYLPIFLALRSVLETWSFSVWTLAYRQFIGGMMAAPPMASAAPLAPLQ